MSTEKRLVLFLVLSVLMFTGMNLAMERLGLLPKPKPKPPAAQATKPEAEKAEAQPPAAGVKPAPPAEKPAAAAKPGTRADRKPAAIPLVDLAALTLGSSADRTANGYRFALRLDQRGAGVDWLALAQYEAEFRDGKAHKTFEPLRLLDEVSKAPPSFSINSFKAEDPTAKPAADQPAKEISLAETLWEVVPDAAGRHKRPILKNGQEVGQEVRFRTVVGSPEVEITRTYRVFKGQDGFEHDIAFASPDAERSIAYELLGPHGVPIEGEWFTSTFRDVAIGQIEDGAVRVATLPAADVVKAKGGSSQRFMTLPVKFAGVENQYFAVLLLPSPSPKAPGEGWIEEVKPIVVSENVAERQKSDISIDVLTKPSPVGPNRGVTHSYRVYAGPKLGRTLAAFGAEEVAAYRKGGIPFVGDLGASVLSRWVIAPLLENIYEATTKVAQLIGFRHGNHGVAIILLTMLVRLSLFPLSRKQAKMAKKMQDLQPQLAEMKEKYKDDKEAMTRETFALYRKYNVNPMGGCLPALIQLPILMGLWQTLNNSVALRHSSFLWIQNLAAPDMLFKFPFDMPSVPLVGSFIGPYFNVLPIIVVSLMMIQTKLFQPPATTPEAEAQQKMMKYMMLVMMLFFYKVPSGLSIYIITSSLWQLCERLLLPKVTTVPHIPPAEEEGGKGGPRGGDGGRGPRGGGNGTPGRPAGWLSETRERAKKKLEQLMEEAAKDKTVRNVGDSRDRGKPRPKPGRKR